MLTAPTNEQEKEKKKRKIRLRKELTVFLDKLRAACKNFENAERWYEFVKPLEIVIEQNADVLMPQDAQKLKDAMKLVDATIEGIKKSCGILEKAIEDVIVLLPAAAGFLAPWIIWAFIGSAVVVGVAVVVFQGLPVQVRIRNQGCETINLGSSVNLPGVSLPREIPKNGEASATLPRVSVNFEANNTGTIQVSVPNTPVQFSFATTAKRIEIDGVNIIGQRKSVNLGDGSSHLVTISCQ